MLSRLYKYFKDDRPQEGNMEEEVDYIETSSPKDIEFQVSRSNEDIEPKILLQNLQNLSEDPALELQLAMAVDEDKHKQGIDAEEKGIEDEIDELTQEFEGDSLIIDENKSTPIQYGTTFANAVDFISGTNYKTIKFNSNVDILSNLENNEDDNEYEWKINRFYLPRLNNYYQLERDHYIYQQQLDEKYSVDYKLEQIEKEKALKVSRIEPLTPQQLAIVSKIVSNPDASRVITSNYQIDLTVRDFKTLRPSKWLNDNIIDYYFNMISDQNPKYYSWTSHFYTTLKQKGYQGVKRWAKRRKLNVFEKSLVFIPINISSTHWALATVDNKAKTIAYYDSLNSVSSNQQLEDDSNDEIYQPRFTGLELIKTYMKGEAERLELANSVDVDEYQLLPNIKVPQQQNGFDCGVFTCICAYYLSTGRPLTYSQRDIPTFRQRMIIELFNNQLLD